MKTGFWSISFEITLDGKTVRYEDLDEVTQEHILYNISNGYFHGEIVTNHEDSHDE